jgi:hypothetical protein
MATLSFLSLLCVIAVISAFPDRQFNPANNRPLVVQPSAYPQKPVVVVQKPGRQQVIQQGQRPLGPPQKRPIIVNPKPGQNVVIVQKQPQVVVVPSRKF